MKNNLNIVLMIVIFMTTLINAAFDGSYTFQLESATQAEINAISSPQNGMMVYNTTSNEVNYYNGTTWINISINSEIVTNLTQSNTTGAITYTNENNITQTANVISSNINNSIVSGTDGGAYLGQTVYTGYFIINNNGSINITGLPFQPSQITFSAHANVESINVDNGSSNTDNRANLFLGSMNGFSRNDNGTITQQIIFSGQSSRETGSPYINNNSRYASSNNCIGIRYGDENGNKIGMLTASLTTFNSDGFTINVVRSNAGATKNLLVLFTAYK